MKIAARTVVVLLLIAYSVMLIRHRSQAAAGSDSSGYLNEARMMRRGEVARPIRSLVQLRIGSSWADAFMPLGFVPWFKDRRLLVPTYPAGLPAHFAIAGDSGSFLIPPLAGILSVILMFVLGRQLGLTEPQSVAGAAVLGATAVFLMFAEEPMSDGVATMWTLATMVLALASVRRRGLFAAAAGIAFAISVCVRPTNLLMAIPLVVAMRYRLRAISIAAAAALPIGVALMLWNHTLYGSYFSTGYGSVVDLLAWSHPRQRLPHYSYWLAAQLTPLVFPIGLIADRRNRALVLAWFFPLFIFYCFYESYDAWWYTRFLLPAIPPLIIGFLLVARRFRLWPIAIAVVLAVAVWQDRRLHPLAIAQEESIYPQTMRWVSGRLPPNAIVLSMQFSGSFLYYLDRETVRYDLIDNNRFQELRAYAGGANLRWYAVLMDFELERFPLAGKWTPVAKTDRGVSLLRLDD